MCMFVDEIRVTDTSIFARRSSSGDGWQMLAYSMKIYSNNQTVMILPLPVEPGEGEDAIRFIDLSGYESFFADMHSACQPAVANFGGDEDDDLRLGGEILTVHEVGDFDASFVPSLDDFHRLDKRFQMPDHVWANMPDYADYGFAVFQLNPVASTFSEFKETHPMAFEFHSRDKGRLFFPTIHVHDGEFHDRAWFDHTLFMQFENEDVVRSRITTAYNRIYEANETQEGVVGNFGLAPASSVGNENDPEGSDQDVILEDHEIPIEMLFGPDENTRFLYSYGPAGDSMQIDLAAGTLDSEQRIFALRPRTKLKNQDTWV